MKDTNKLTIQSYEAHSRDYLTATAGEPTDGVKTWIQAAVSGLTETARILEIGSGSGRDAAFIESLGFDVECSEASQSFVSHLLESGFYARKINVLTDPIMGSYDLIFANNVLPHFTKQESIEVMKNVHTALKNRGRFAFSVERGTGEDWTSEKFLIPRYYRSWNSYDLEATLEDAGYTKITIEEYTPPDSKDSVWLHVIAYK